MISNNGAQSCWFERRLLVNENMLSYCKPLANEMHVVDARVIVLGTFRFQIVYANGVDSFLNYAALDEMGSRIDELEQSINELRTEMGQEGSPSPALKSKDDSA